MYKLNITDKDINIDIEDIDEYIKYIEKLTNIQWRIIPDLEDYIISEYGDIITLRSKKILEPFLNIYGYYQISLCKDTIYKTFKIHRLVYKAFIDQDIEDFDVHHKDGNKLNNHYSNLQKMTKSAHTKCHHNLENEDRLKEYKKYYIDRYENNLSTEEIIKKYNVSKTTITLGIQKYKIYLSNNKDINKYNSSNSKEKKDFYSNVILKENKRRYLEKAKEIYNKKIKEHLTDKQLSKIYNISKTGIGDRIQNIKAFIKILNRDFDKFYKLSKKEKIQLRKDITEIEKKEYLKEYLKKAEEIYNKRNKEHLTYEQLAKIYNVPEYIIRLMIKDIKIYIYILNRDFNKFYKLTSKEKRNLQKNITEIERKEYVKKYLEKAEEIYNKKIKENLTYEQLSKIYNIPESSIECYIQEIKCYIFLLDRDFNKFYKLTKKEKLKLRKDIIEIENKKYLKKYLEKAEEIYNRKNKEHLTNKQLAKIYNTLETNIERYIQDIKIYIYILNRNFDKFYNFSGKEKLKLRKKITIIDKRNNNILDIGKQIKDLKLSGISNKDIANRLNLSINRIYDMYKKYKKLINDRKIKDELKSIKKYKKGG